MLKHPRTPSPCVHLGITAWYTHCCLGMRKNWCQVKLEKEDRIEMKTPSTLSPIRQSLRSLSVLILWLMSSGEREKGIWQNKESINEKWPNSHTFSMIYLNHIYDIYYCAIKQLFHFWLGPCFILIVTGKSYLK